MFCPPGIPLEHWPTSDRSPGIVLVEISMDFTKISTEKLSSSSVLPTTNFDLLIDIIFKCKTSIVLAIESNLILLVVPNKID